MPWEVNVLFRHEEEDRVLPILDEMATFWGGSVGVSGSEHQGWEFPWEEHAQSFAREAHNRLPNVTVIEPEAKM